MPIAITGQDIVSGAFDAFNDTSLIPLLPFFMRQLLEGNTSIIPPLAEGALADQIGLADAMFTSVTCGDEAGLHLEDELDAVREVNPLYEGFAGYEGRICDEWDVRSPRNGFNEPVTSDVRSLVLAGEFDPGHPPFWSRSAADHLGDAVFVEVPGVGHGVVFSNECGSSIAQAFIEDPEAEPDTGCVAARGPVNWATE
jgi:pimeloyl-ACP methyl ester carboxylesterase